MKLTNLKINNFGKLKDKNIDLSDNINIIYGENESGKSTLLKFITSSLYGINRNKAGNYAPDYERFTPWDQSEFSGKVSYKLDSGEKYEIYRDFTKKSPKIFNENMEDVTKSFSSDKTKGSRFFHDQTGVDEDLFLSTIVSEQQAVKLEAKEQNNMIQKMTNILGTGENSVSFQNTINKLNKRITNEIGTKNTREKPINILEKRKKELEDEIKYIEDFENEKYAIDETKKEEEALIKRKEIELDMAKRIQELENTQTLKKEKINVLKEAEDNQRKDIMDLEEKLNEIESPKTKKINSKISIVAICFALIIGVVAAIIFKPLAIKIISILLPVIVGAVISFYYLNNAKKNKSIEKNIENKKRAIELELQKQEKQLEDRIKENQTKEHELDIEYKNAKDKINLLFKEKLDELKINQIANSRYISEDIRKIQEVINESKLNIHRIELDEKNVMPKLEELSKKAEELEDVKEDLEGLTLLLEAVQMAKENIEQAYLEMKNNVSPQFTEKLSETIRKISDGKYSKVRLSDEFGIVVENEKGDYVPAEALSIGTIDQLYLALRLATIDDISKEKLPIILDEAFAYFDGTRMENLLRFLHDNYSDRQLIIFTCTNREKEIIEKNNFKYKLIEL